MNLETWAHLWLQPAGFVSSLDSRQLPPACRICRPGVDLPDCLKVPASMHFEEDDMPVQPPPAPVAEAKRKAAPKGKAKAKSSVGNGFRKRCIVCQDPDKPCCEKNPYCKEDKVDVEGLRKDSKKNGWNEKFEHALQNDHALFRRFILDYQETCPKKGRGVPRAAYSKTRLQHILSTAKVTQEGFRMEKLDWFGFELFYAQKKFSAEQIRSKWQDAVQKYGVHDRLGDNPDYPERALVKVSDFVQGFNEKKNERRVLQESANDGSLLDDEKGTDQLRANSSAADWNAPLFDEDGDKEVRDRMREAVPKRRNSGASAASSNSPGPAGGTPANSSLSDLMVHRLRTREDLKSSFTSAVNQSYQRTRRRRAGEYLSARRLLSLL